ncbi:sigma-70 family RNA polymerase sigma factor [Apilactobacillus micheneri]|uniref:RNA polymerase sigma factor n=1 Tax=Apilactobacillus micheneri TaxID=1899430 RepID=UPI00112BCAD6|nr:sigma-70 family RNA polymerase sigma factor [Apilactobacillus micheneri]TPR43663.1 sigma-70 family RNA polymerase sigma factor [Apilactobacillus micheneri]TPR47591.1 sigma-70 family RNA polymerase sigma factor [Apilactobacillus micheneri]
MPKNDQNAKSAVIMTKSAGVKPAKLPVIFIFVRRPLDKFQIKECCDISTYTQLNDGFNYLMQGDHRVVIFGVLKRLNIQRNTPQYDDLMQEGFIIFAKKYYQYQGPDDDKQRLAYLYQGVYWHLLDQLRKASRNTQKIEFMSANNQDSWENQLIDEYSFESELSHNELLNELWKISSKTERKLIYYSYYEGIDNMREISRQTHISTKTLNKWRKSLRQKINLIKN